MAEHAPLFSSAVGSAGADGITAGLRPIGNTVPASASSNSSGYFFQHSFCTPLPPVNWCVWFKHLVRRPLVRLFYTRRKTARKAIP